MTNRQLSEGNKLSAQLTGLGHQKKALKRILKRLDLEDSRPDSIINPGTVSVSMDNIECEVNKSRLIAFLWEEHGTVDEEITQTEKQFANL